MAYAMHVRGKTTNLTVNEALEYQFKRNEDRAMKLTDEQIAEWMAKEFPVTVATNVHEIRTRRRHYNVGMGVWKDRGAAGGTDSDRPLSTAYDEAGNPVSDTTPVRQVTVNKATGITEDRVKQLIAEVAGQESVSINQIEALIAQKFVESRPMIQVVIPGKSEVTMGAGSYHKQFTKVLRKVSAGVPVLLVGPAGTGKTKLASQVAEALNRPFTFNSFSGGTKETDLFGRSLPIGENGAWVFQPAPFVHSYVNGGVHLLDEMDAADSNLLVSINAAIANRRLSIPISGNPVPFERHEDNVIIGAANTYGTGPDRMYVGRNQLDAATLNRFGMATITIDYDRELETNIAMSYFAARDGGEITPDSLSLCQDFLEWCWKVRAIINTNKLRRIMSTRNIEDGCKCLIAGDTLAELKLDYLEGWTEDEKRKVA